MDMIKRKLVNFKSRFKEWQSHIQEQKFSFFLYYILSIFLFACFHFFLWLKIEVSQEHYSYYGYLFNVFSVFLFFAWSSYRIILPYQNLYTFLSNIIIILLSLKYYYLLNNDKLLILSILFVVLNFFVQYFAHFLANILSRLSLKKYAPIIDILFFIKIISIFYSYSKMTLFCKLGCFQDDFVLFYRGIVPLDFDIFIGESFLFWVAIFGVWYVYYTYKLTFLCSLCIFTALHFILLIFSKKMNVLIYNFEDGWGVLMFSIYSLCIILILLAKIFIKFSIKKIRG